MAVEWLKTVRSEENVAGKEKRKKKRSRSCELLIVNGRFVVIGGL